MDDWDAEFFSCPICNRTDVVPACGPEDSPILLIGTSPSDEEVKAGQPFAGKTGGVLKTELRLAGLDFGSLRVMNLWQHPANENEKCKEHGASACISEAQGKQAILLIGAETVKFFTGKSVEAYNGLLVPSSYFSCPIVVAMVQPTTVFHNSCGELRLSLQKFSRMVESFV